MAATSPFRIVHAVCSHDCPDTCGVLVTVNSEGRAGVNHKTLFVTANTKGVQNYSLQFVVQVEKKPS